MIHVLSHRLSASGVRLSQTRTSSAELPVSCEGRGRSRLQLAWLHVRLWLALPKEGL